MKKIIPCIVALLLVLGIVPVVAQDASSSSGDDMFNSEESVQQTTQETQNAAPRDTLLKESAPRLTGTFTSKVSAAWSWNDVWNKTFDFINPDSTTLNQETTGAQFGFVARPDTDISLTAEFRTYYPFTQVITTGTAPNTTTYTVPDVSIWSLYSKFEWNDVIFFSFGKQPIKWGTGYFFSPADDIFAQSVVDVTDPTAEREGPLALKIQYPIPGTMDNLYFFAAMPPSNNPSTVATMTPDQVAVAGKAEFLFGNTEVAAAGFYQSSSRPQAILMATTGTNNFNFFGEGVVAFAAPSADYYLQKSSSGAYSTVDRSADTIFSGTAGMMYSNADWNFTFVTQYLYNGYGSAALTLKDYLAAAPVLGYETLYSTFSGLGKIGQHYGVAYVSWTELWNTKLDFSVLSLMNFSDGSGYVQPTVSFTTFTYVKISGGISVSWGGTGTEYADPNGLATALLTGGTAALASYSSTPTLSFILTLSFGTVSF